jgi:hypothetical protein
MEDPTRRRNLGVWLVSSALAAIILLALLVGARRWADEHPTRAAAASGSTVTQGEADDLLNVPAEAPPAEPSPVNPAGGIDKAEGEPMREPADVKPPAPIARPASGAKKGQLPTAPKLLPAAPAGPSKQKVKAAIPDNPY